MAEKIIIAQNIGAAGETFSIDGVDYTVGVNAFATIKQAVEQAKSSSEKITIEICSGEYTENVSFGPRIFIEDGKTYVGGITFKAADGADVKINGYFQCNGTAGDLKDIVFDGLEITNSVRNGGYFAPIMFGDNYSGKTASGIVIQNCTLNSSTGAASGTCSGVALTMGLICDGITISNNTINAECGVYGGDGNLISNTSIVGNTMNGSANESTYNYWGMIYIYNSGSGNEITGNTIDTSAMYAVRIRKGDGIVLTDNIISDCTKGVVISDGSVSSGNTVDGEELTYPAYSGNDVFVFDKIAGNTGDAVVIDGVLYTVGTDVFADVNAAAAAAEASAGKLVVVKGADAAYTANPGFFLNAPGTEIESGVWSYDAVVDAAETYDLQVDGTFSAYQVL